MQFGTVLRLIAGAGLALVVACAPAPQASAPAPAATTAPAAPAAQPTLSGKPVAAQATTAPAAAAAAPAVAATAAPAAVKPTAATSTPKRGGTLRMMMITDAQGMDPQKTTETTTYVTSALIYEPLMVVDPAGNLEPTLAEKWDVSADGLTYTFTIRSGVKFHNGRTMTAEDVKYSIDRVRDPKTASPRVKNFAPIESTSAPNATTFVVKLSEPSAPLLSNLAHSNASIVPKEVVEANNGELKQVAVGTGPFKFVEWVRDQHVKLERNSDYWRQGQPYLDGITITFNADDNARTAAVRSGGVDFLFQVPPSLVDVVRRDPNLTLHGGEAGSWNYWDLNSAKAPFDNLKIRQALFTALDRKEIADLARPGTATLLFGGFISPSRWAGIKEPVFTQDVAKAKQLLAEGGQPNGFKMTINTLTGWDFHIRTAQAIQQQLKPIGVEADIKILEAGVLLGDAAKGNYDSIVLGFSATTDPDDRLSQTFVCGGGTNWSKWCDPELDAMAAEARKITDLNRREQMYRDIQLKLTREGSKAFLFMWHNYDALHPYVKGYVWNAAPSYHGLREVWLDK